MPINHTFLVVLGIVLSGLILCLGFILSTPSVITYSSGLKPLVAPTILTTPKIIEVSEPNTSDSILFLGDVLLARNVEFLMNTMGQDYPWKNIAPVLQSYKTVVGNFESAMADPHVQTESFVMRFSTPVSALDTLVSSGITHLSLANNHAYDFAQAGYDNAEQKLTEKSLTSFGHPELVSATSSVAMIEINGMNIAVIAMHAVFSVPNKAQVEALFELVNKTSDKQIVYIHWGDEYITTHNKTQENFSKLLISSGADAIVGHHPHVTQDIEDINGVPVFYSLGNFLFDQYFGTDVQQGYMLALTPTKDELTFKIIPITSLGTKSQPRLMEGAERATFLDSLAKRSSPKYSEYILSGQGILPFNLATSSQTSMISE